MGIHNPVEQTSSWTGGGKASIEAKGKAGIPFVASGEAKAAAEASLEHGLETKSMLEPIASSLVFLAD